MLRSKKLTERGLGGCQVKGGGGDRVKGDRLEGYRLETNESVHDGLEGDGA